VAPPDDDGGEPSEELLGLSAGVVSGTRCVPEEPFEELPGGGREPLVEGPEREFQLAGNVSKVVSGSPIHAKTST
jgi:hypothetical protein